MYRQNLVDYDHKPQSHHFGAEASMPAHSSYPQNATLNERVRSDQRVNHPNRLTKNFPDVFVKEFICDQIIQTIGSNNEFKFFCFYCSNYFKDIDKVREHVLIEHHNNMRGKVRYNKGLNKRFTIKSINGKDLEYLSEKEKQEMIFQELDRIPNDQKHFYVRRGIRLMNVIGEYAYYCRMCEKPISSFTLIANHLETETHQRLENRTDLSSLVKEGKHELPIVGLQFIIEYNNSSMNEIIYKCSFCDVFKNAEQMYSHLFDSKHRINVLNKLENTDYQYMSEEDLNSKINEWHKKIGMGFVTETKETPNMNGYSLGSSMEQLRAIFGSFRPKSCDSIESLFAVRIRSESEANKVLEIIESIKNASIKYHNHKNGQNSNHFH